MFWKIILTILAGIALAVVCTLLQFDFSFFGCKCCEGNFDYDADIKKGDIHLILYGMPNYQSFTGVQTVAKRYGFQYQIRGCVTKNDDLKCSDKYNEKIKLYLETRNGIGWFNKFKASSDSVELYFYTKNKKDATPPPK